MAKDDRPPPLAEEVRPPARFQSFAPRALGLGVAALSVSILWGQSHAAQLWHSYLVAFVFHVTLALGALFFVLVQFVSRAGWSVGVRRLAEHAMGTLPVMALLGVPLAFGLSEVYPWASPETVAADPLLQEKAVYLNPAFFLVRGGIFLGGWALLGWWFRRTSLRQDATGDDSITRKLQAASPAGLIFFGLSITFAAFDWIMSLDPHWYSTIFGVYLFSGAVVGGFALIILLGLAVKREGAMTRAMSEEHFHDLGKLLFGFVAFWAYIAFSQFMLIWYANIPEETVWYAHRLAHGWSMLTVSLAVGHFVLPFFFLLPRDVKRRPGTLFVAGAWLLLMHFVDIYWLVMPSLHPEGPMPHLLDLLTLLGMGGVFWGSLCFLMRRTALVPLGDPRLQESLHFEAS